MKSVIKSKRFFSYCIDIVVVSLLILLLSKINILNPNQNKYNEAVQKYSSYLQELTNTNISITLDKKIYSLTYDVQYYSISNYMISFVVYILYFTLFPYFNNSQTIGKRLLKIKYERADGKKITLFNYFIRSLIIPCSLSLVMCIPVSYIFNVLLVLLLKGKVFYYTMDIVSLLICIYCYVDIVQFLSSVDNVAFHDKITKIKVIESK